MAEIPLYRRSNIVGYAFVDAADFSRLQGHRWGLLNAGNGYAARWEKRKPILMHRDLLGARGGEEVDHINRNGLDNRRINLRIGTHALNMQNQSPKSGSRSRFRGVSFDSDRNRWTARAELNGTTYRIGRFDTEQDAAIAASEWRSRNMPFAVEAKA